MIIRSLLTLIILSFVGAEARADLFLPDKVSLLTSSKTPECGLQADYELDTPLRVEISVARSKNAYVIAGRVYSPNLVTPPLRDIWLDTNNFSSLGRFRPAFENSNGITETRGEVKVSEEKAFVEAIENGELTVSIIFDGPSARFPVGLPKLTTELSANIDRCIEGL